MAKFWLYNEPRPFQGCLRCGGVKRQSKTFWLLHEHCRWCKCFHCCDYLFEGDVWQLVWLNWLHLESTAVLLREWIARASNHTECTILRRWAWTLMPCNASTTRDLVSQKFELTMTASVCQQELPVILVGLRNRLAHERDAHLLPRGFAVVTVTSY